VSAEAERERLTQSLLIVAAGVSSLLTGWPRCHPRI
jgi:hypothetical protein